MTAVSLPLAAPPVPDVEGLRRALDGQLAGEVRWDRLSRALYSTDASVYQIVPAGVVLPAGEEDVVAVVRACARHRVPLTARGGGTSQAGQAIGPGLILDCSRHLNRILEINAAAGWARVQPGCVLDELNLAVRPFGLHFPLDISTSDRATLGGMIANNSAGTRSVVYGKTVDHVLELKVVLSDGSVVILGPLEASEVEARCRREDLEGACHRIVRDLGTRHAEEIARRYPRLLRRVGGYNLDRFTPDSPHPFNLAHLLVGSEGTLAVTLEAKVRLVPLPKARAVLLVTFADLLDALAATPAILAHHPSAVEVMDRYVLDGTRHNAEASRLRDLLHGDPAAILIIEVHGDAAGALPGRIEAIEADLRRQGFGLHYHRAPDAAGQARVWKLRRLALGLSMAEKGDAKAQSFVEDTAVGVEHLRDYIAEFLDLIARHGTQAGVYAHASVGCLHVRPVVDLKTAEGVQRFESIAAGVAELVLEYGGALSGEHGDGLVRSPFLEKMFGPVLYEAFRTIKRTFDPQNLFNPGKIVDAPPLASNLRYGPAYVTPQVDTTFDFRTEGGLARAAELCAGVGECRKTRAGTMCPSYQATRDEQHSTRGRANALRLALTGQVGLAGLADPALHEVFDLCLECKACKAECPTNVDVARLKAEFLHQYYRANGLPWRNRLFGHVARLGRWGCALAPLSNWLIRSRPVRWLNEKLLGIDRRRLPPAFARRTFVQAFRVLMRESAQGGGVAVPPLGGKDRLTPGLQLGGRQVLLWPDTFTNHHEPEVGLAAVELLRRLGCAVQVEAPGGLWCCGRPLISNGLLDEAVRHARHNIEVLHPLAASGHVIVACEPSCLLTVKDDYPALAGRDLHGKAAAVAAACLTLEGVLDILWDEKGGLELRPGPAKVLVQGHCHQRALVGMGPLLRLLRRIPGAEVIDLDAGCCGMAGSFGYEREHYDVSLRVGEQRLFPALRRTPQAMVVAPGLSCRMQIAHATGRAALHPAALLRKLLPAPGAGAPTPTFFA
jgi:FAD/FMN-containing dehydrogenase/Fe-S oxidoreductase